MLKKWLPVTPPKRLKNGPNFHDSRRKKKDLKTIHEDQLRRAVDADDRHADGRAARVGAAREGGQGKLLKDSVSTLVKDNTAFKMANFYLKNSKEMSSGNTSMRKTALAAMPSGPVPCIAPAGKKRVEIYDPREGKKRKLDPYSANAKELYRFYIRELGFDETGSLWVYLRWFQAAAVPAGQGDVFTRTRNICTSTGCSISCELLCISWQLP